MSLRKSLIKSLRKAVEKLDLTVEESLVEEAKVIIEDVMKLTTQVIKPDAPQLTEKEFKEIFKSVSLTQDSEKIKKEVGETVYREFYNNRQSYITKYKHLIGGILNEVQKELSENV